MYKREFIEQLENRIAEEFHIDDKTSKKVSKKVVETILEKMRDSFINGDGSKIHNFGSFNIKERKQTKRYDPYTKETYAVQPRNVVFFKCYETMRERIHYNTTK